MGCTCKGSDLYSGRTLGLAIRESRLLETKEKKKILGRGKPRPEVTGRTTVHTHIGVGEATAWWNGGNKKEVE